MSGTEDGEVLDITYVASDRIKIWGYSLVKVLGEEVGT